VNFDYNKVLSKAGNDYRTWVTYLIGYNWYRIKGSAIAYGVGN